MRVLTSSETALMWYGSNPQHPPMYLTPKLYASLAYLCMSHLVQILGSSARKKVMAIFTICLYISRYVVYILNSTESLLSPTLKMVALGSSIVKRLFSTWLKGT